MTRKSMTIINRNGEIGDCGRPKYFFIYSVQVLARRIICVKPLPEPRGYIIVI